MPKGSPNPLESGVEGVRSLFKYRKLFLVHNTYLRLKTLDVKQMRVRDASAFFIGVIC